MAFWLLLNTKSSLTLKKDVQSWRRVEKETKKVDQSKSEVYAEEMLSNMLGDQTP